MAAFLLLTLALSWAFAQGKYCMSTQFRRPGDYMLGGLFPFTVHTGNVRDRFLPEIHLGHRVNNASLIWAFGMKLAVEEINNSTTLLPGITLGYDIYDTSVDPMLALHPSMLFLSRTGTNTISVLCNYTDYEPRVVAIIGPHSSELALLTAKLFSFFLVPQVSYGATTEKLNDDELYPSFFRTVPGDKVQVEALIQLLLAFQWNWIAIIGSDEEYGREGISLLSAMVTKYGICIAYEGLIPADVTDPYNQDKLKRTITAINDTNVNVIILFSVSQAVRELFKVTLALGLKKKVWLASEAWVMSGWVATIKNIRAVGMIMGFVIKGWKIPLFTDYVHHLLEETQQDDFCQASQEQAMKVTPDVLGPQCSQCSNISRETMNMLLDHRQTFPVYAAVYGVAHALHKVLHCQKGQCQKNSIKPWQLLEKLRTVNFTIHNKSLNFSQDKSVGLSFKLIGWAWRNKQVEHVVLGEFDGNLTMNASKIQFYTEDRKPPRSECFTGCLPGQIRQMKGFQFCCYDCIDCESGTFRSSLGETGYGVSPGSPRIVVTLYWGIERCWDHRWDVSTCTPCPQHQWSPPRSTKCYDRCEKYLFWSEPGTVALLFVMCFALTLIGFTAVLFVKHFRTPAVQATGGVLSLVSLFSLALLCLNVIFLIGKPSCTICKLYNLSLGLSTNLCYSPIMVKALQILLAHDFADSRPSVLHRLIRKHPWVLVALSFLVETSLGLIYLYWTPALLFKNYSALPTEVLFQCVHPTWFMLFLLHGHNGAVVFTSFLCTFMVQSPPKKYNAARAITFAVITYFITLVVTIPSFATAKPIYHPAIIIAAILSGALGVLATYYLPKCYILCFKPEWNTWDYFQDYTKENLQEKDS